MTRLPRKDDRVLCEFATKQKQGMPYLSVLYNIGLNPSVVTERSVGLVKRNSVRARTPAEKYRDDVLLGYPEWSTWSRKLRRIFVSLPSYGVGEDALETMCEDFNWEYTQTTNLVDKNTSFKEAVNEFVGDNYEYRTVTYFNKNKVALTFQVKWSALQRVYMMESGITSFIKAETGKVSAAENKLIEKAGLLEIEPMVNLPQEKTPTTQNNNQSNTFDLSGESSLFELEDILNKG